MNTDRDIGSELEIRIRSELNAFQENLPERYAIAWHGYLAGLLEWGIIDLALYKRLLTLLPPIPDPNPITTILSGRE
jgi:hypothetical protein